jgi:hypothetical protein
MKSTLTKDWSEYNHDYEKRVQDIRTKDGNEYIECWPNAGKWTVLTHRTGLFIPDADVTHTRLHPDEYKYESTSE